MKQLSCMVLIALIVSSCLSQQRREEINCDKMLTEAIKENWKYDSVQDFYSANESFLKRLDTGFYKCLFNKDTSYLTTKFGGNHVQTWDIPSQFHRDSLFYAIQYLISLSCNSQGNSAVCKFYQFIYDKNGKIKKTGRIQITKSSVH